VFVCLVQDVIHDGPLEPCVLTQHTHGEHLASLQRRTCHVEMKHTNAAVRMGKMRSNVCSVEYTSLCDSDSVTAQSNAAALVTANNFSVNLKNAEIKINVVSCAERPVTECGL
jgi:hypothetical protein